jgi:hypothetical protein
VYGCECWLGVEFLGLNDLLEEEHNSYIFNLCRNGIPSRNDFNLLVWSCNSMFNIPSAKLVYDSIIYAMEKVDRIWWFQIIWHNTSPLKI